MNTVVRPASIDRSRSAIAATPLNTFETFSSSNIVSLRPVARGTGAQHNAIRPRM